MKQCQGCSRTEERTKTGWRKIRLNKDGICAACKCAEEEIAAEPHVNPYDRYSPELGYEATGRDRL